MNKVLKILSRVICIIVFVLMIFSIVFINTNKIRGQLLITINGNEYMSEYLECTYLGEEKNQKVIYKNNDDGYMTFKNKGSLHGMYGYTIPITAEEIEMTTKIFLFKTSWWKIYDLNVNIDIHAEDELWNADVFVEVDGRVYRQMFFDVENNTVEVYVE